MPRSSESPSAGPVAAPPSSPYTGAVRSERATAPLSWWRDTVRSWVPVLGLAALIVFQMIGLQRQIGGLRADLRDEIRRESKTLQTDVQREIRHLRDDIGKLGERITRLETMMELRAEGSLSRPGG